MTIDEAIKHAEEVMVENLEKTKGRNASDPIAMNCFECAEEHRQLAEWLKELKAYKEQTDGDLISRDYVLSKFKEQCDRCGKYKENNGVMCNCCALDAAIDYVEDAPSAEKTDGDLISRQAVIDKIRSMDRNDHIDEYTENVIEYFEKLPSAEKTTEWILVRKQKPEDYEEVIATVRYDYKDKQEYEVVTGVRYSKEEGWEWAYEAGSDYWESIDGVVAWQPLPKPYEVRR